MSGFQAGSFQSPGFQQTAAGPVVTLPRHAHATLALPALPQAAVTVPERPAGAISVPNRPTADLEA